jgi:type I restriction enzyme M protein
VPETSSNQLRTRLWEAANVLRGSAVDRTDWKGYILPLLFFKRISDVWDEEAAEASQTDQNIDSVRPTTWFKNARKYLLLSHR